MKPPDNAKGAAPKDRAPRKTLAREFDSSSSVKACQMAVWLDVALGLAAKAKTSATDLHHLEVWLQRMRRALPR